MVPIKNNKAQVSAPFEVLIAVIIMMFVIVSGNYALKNLSENTCLGDKRQDFSNLISSLREVILGSDLAYRTIDFSTKACYNENYERTYLYVVSDDKDMCERYCGSGTSCVLLMYSYENEERRDYKLPIPPICTYLPTNIVFGSDTECDITDPNDPRDAIDPREDNGNIQNGTYKISKLSDNNQYRICMVKIR
jgi:hypothetical protein